MSSGEKSQIDTTKTYIDEPGHCIHLGASKDGNLPAIKALFNLLRMPQGMLERMTQGEDEPVLDLQRALNDVIYNIIMTQQALREGFPFWGINLLNDNPKRHAEREKRLQQAESFFQSLEAYLSSDKLQNIPYSASEVLAHNDIPYLLNGLSCLRETAMNYSPLVSWLAVAEASLPSDHPWIERMQATRQEVLEAIRQFSHLPPPIPSWMNPLSGVDAKLNALKQDYILAYIDLHTQVRLDINDDKRKSGLLNDPRLHTLLKLATLDRMPQQPLTDWQNRLATLTTCFALTEQDLYASPICPHCGFRPSLETGAAQAASQTIRQLDTQLNIMLATWISLLLNNLKDPIAQANMALLNPNEREALGAFIQSKQLPVPVDSDFIHALKAVFSGVIKVTVTMHALQQALQVTDGLVTPEAIKKRFESYIDQLAIVKDPERIRIMVE